MGILTSRDAWVYGFSKEKVEKNTERLIQNYNSELKRLKNIDSDKRKEQLNRNTDYINWSRKLERFVVNNINIFYQPEQIKLSMYRPFTKKWLYHDKKLNEEARIYYNKFGQENLVINTTGRGVSRDFSVFISNLAPNQHTMDTGQGFMRYDNEVDEKQLFQSNDNMNQAFADKLGLSLDDTFAYVYGLLNARDYQEKYANDLKKDLARIPIVKHKEKYVEVGKALMNLHLNYEEVPIYEAVTITPLVNPTYKDITISDIPEKAYQYVVNGRSAIEWIMDQYQVKTDKKSGITDDPNDYSTDEKYIFNLLLRIINVSIQTVDLIESLPPFEVEE